MPADRLELEITETTIIADPARAKAVLARLRAMGIDLAVDDFGTGYTSLGWLRELGCDLVQGYHLSRPQPEAVLTPWLRTAASTAETGGLSAELSA